MRKFILGTLMAVGVAAFAAPAHAAGGGNIHLEHPKDGWSWEGVFGSYDQHQLRRGFQVYQTICANCHGLDLMYYRNLGALGYTPDEIKEIAAQKQVEDGPNDQGEMFQRAAKPSDHFVNPFPNEEFARMVNGGALPPDLSLIVKARPGGADYIYSLMLGFKDTPPEGFELLPGQYYNEFYPGHAISMPPQLFEGMVSYEDGTEASEEQMAEDITAFLAWASSPELEARKQLGLKVMIFLIVFTAMLFALKKMIWKRVH